MTREQVHEEVERRLEKATQDHWEAFKRDPIKFNERLLREMLVGEILEHNISDDLKRESKS